MKEGQSRILAEALALLAALPLSAAAGHGLTQAPRQEELDAALVDASWRGSTEAVQGLLNLGANPNASDSLSRRPLAQAAMWGQLDIMNMLIAVGAQVDGEENCNTTALQEAAAFGQLDAIALLLADNANIEARTCTGASPLFTAAQRRQNLAIALLLQRGANPNARVLGDGLAEHGETALLAVVRYGGNWAVIDALLADPRTDANARVLGGYDQGMTTLKYAAKYGQTDFVKALLARPGIDVNDAEGGVTALALAKIANNQDIVDLLIAAGARE